MYSRVRSWPEIEKGPFRLYFIGKTHLQVSFELHDHPRPPQLSFFGLLGHDFDNLDMFIKSNETHLRNTRHSSFYRVPSFKSVESQKSLSYGVVICFNSIC